MSDYMKKYYDYQTQARGLLTRESLTARFEKLSKWYGSRLGFCLPRDKRAHCLDVPCGFGNFLYFLKEKGYSNIHGIDLDKSQVELAALMGLPAEQNDAFQFLSEVVADYDQISSLDFIEHLDKDKALEFLTLSYHALKSGGCLIIRAPCADGPFGSHDAWNDLTHEWSMTANVLQTILEMNGFVNVQVLDERPQPTSGLEFLRWVVYFPSIMLANAFCMAIGMRPPRIWSRSMIAVAYKPASL